MNLIYRSLPALLWAILDQMIIGIRLYTAANTDATNLADQALGGLIREDIMEKIWLIDKFPLVLTDMCSKATSGNAFKEFTTDELGASEIDNALRGLAQQEHDLREYERKLETGFPEYRDPAFPFDEQRRRLEALIDAENAGSGYAEALKDAVLRRQDPSHGRGG